MGTQDNDFELVRIAEMMDIIDSRSSVNIRFTDIVDSDNILDWSYYNNTITYHDNTMLIDQLTDFVDTHHHHFIEMMMDNCNVLLNTPWYGETTELKELIDKLSK